MNMAKELTYSVAVLIDNKEIPLYQVKSDDLQQIKDNWSKRLTGVMSDYYSSHPDEFRKLLESEV